ncbi:uncharacterized protein LOC122244176 [Penaeus japonicus]|uniref:uncharacterized protein LOC122244176 n=1 Tax=Penaeus japonicus TaxID=27405 RepID=UPI001C70B9AC|nr:uncharacterized protein LOC122244176 [Penaeus japonicus]
MRWLLARTILAGLLLVTSQARNNDDARVVAAFSTRTVVTLTTVTTTVPLTCASFFGTMSCQKRRVRRLVKMSDHDIATNGDFDPLVQSTLDDAPEGLDHLEDQRFRHALARDPRIALTIWSTSSSTFTYTSESTDLGTTFSLSYYCTAVGASFPPAC